MSEREAATVSVDDVAGRFEQLMRLHGPPHRRAPEWLAHELTFSQLRILFLLREHGSLTMSGLAEALGVTPATGSGVVERLERHGLVERRHRPGDRRIVECALTGAGEDLVRGMAGARLDAVRTTLAVLTADELNEFDRLLGLVIERLAARAHR